MADTSIKVCVRFRPQNSREKAEGGQICVSPKGETGLTITTTEGGTKPPQEKDFNFDRVFMMDSEQETVFNYVAKPVLDDCFAGFNGTVFAYGQTGSGKTHTMMGTGINDPNGRGIIPRVMFSLFEHISSAPPTTDFAVKVNYVEIYMEKVKDLIDTTKNNLSIREDPKRGIYIQDVTDTYIASPQDAFDVMATGDRNRVVAFTQMNAGSSRSHSIFTLNIEVTDNEKGTINNSKLNLVDLAGSEKIAKTGAEGQQLEEAKKINQSLSALGNVINALTDPNSKHVPYRDSKLTRILQESLGGNAKTTLIVCCSSSSWNDFETVSSLRFGMRAKSIKNKVEANTELSKEQMKKIIRDLEIKVRNYEEYIKYLEGGGAPDPSFKAKNSRGKISSSSSANPNEETNTTETINGENNNAQSNSTTENQQNSITQKNQNELATNSITNTETNDQNNGLSPSTNNSSSVQGNDTSNKEGVIGNSNSGPESEKTLPNSAEVSPGVQPVANEYIHSLQEKVINLESTVQSTTNELESYKMLHDDLYAELVSGEESRAQLEKEIEELKNKNEEMIKKQEKLKNLEEEYNTLKELYSSISAEHEEETTELANEIDSLRNELTQKRIELRNLQNKVELSANGQSGNQTISNEAIEVERASWNVERIKHEEEVRNLNNEIDDLREEIKELQAYLEETENLQQEAKKMAKLQQQQQQQAIPPSNNNIPIQDKTNTINYQNEAQINNQIPQNVQGGEKSVNVVNDIDHNNISNMDKVNLATIQGNIINNNNNNNIIDLNNISAKSPEIGTIICNPGSISSGKETVTDASAQKIGSQVVTPEINGVVIGPKELEYVNNSPYENNKNIIMNPLLLDRNAKILEESKVQNSYVQREELELSNIQSMEQLTRETQKEGQILTATDSLQQQQMVNGIVSPQPIDFASDKLAQNSEKLSPSLSPSTMQNNACTDPRMNLMVSTELVRNGQIEGNNKTPNIAVVQGSSGNNLVNMETKYQNVESCSTQGQDLSKNPGSCPEKQKFLVTPGSHKDPQMEKTIADLKNKNKELCDQLATSKLEAAEMVRTLYTKINAKTSENMKLKILLEENNISYGEDYDNIVGGKHNSILSLKRQDTSGEGSSRVSGKDKHDAFAKEKQELKKKISVLTRNMSNLTEEHERALSQYNALTLNYRIEKNKFLKELGRKDMELEQMSKVLTYRTIHEGEVQKKLDEMIEMNEMLKRTLEEKMRNVVVGGARIIRGGGSQGVIRGGSGGNVHSISGGGNGSLNSTNNNAAARSQLSIEIPRTSVNNVVMSGSSASGTPLTSNKSASCRSFMTQNRIATASATSGVSASSRLVSGSLLPSGANSQDATPIELKPRRKSFSGLRRKIEGSKN